MSWRQDLPARYDEPWHAEFDGHVARALSTGDSVHVLDIGSGRNPTVPRENRPQGTVYVGLDVSAEELAAAPDGAYDEAVVSDASTWRPELAGRFDLALSWQVLEHVPDLASAANNAQGYLKPGGVFVALFSGGLAVYSLANRVLPDRLGAALVTRAMNRTDRNPVFPAHYDRCTYRGITRAFTGWTELEITPKYRAASYFRRIPLAMKTYLAYENVAAGRWPNLATHYLVVATR